MSVGKEEANVKNQELVPVDEKMIVEVSRDRMLATVYFEEALNGGKLLTEQEIQDMIAEKGICEGINQEVLQKIKKSRQHNYRYIIAQGTMPKDGEDAKIELSFNAKALTDFKPTLNEDGTVDFKNLNIVHNVKAGDVLAKKTPATDGEDGVNVFGSSVRAKRGKDKKLPKGKNTRASDNRLSLIASTDGKLEYENQSIAINPVFIVSGNVDTSTGNINFLGSVVINGNVTTGFTVKATGSVDIRGYVEDATIEAGGDIIVAYGIQGTEKGKLVSGGNVVVKFIQNASVEAMKDVVTEAIMHSKVSAGNTIKVENGKGTIVGGQVSATNMVIAKSIGSPMGTVTVVNIGVLPTTYQKHKQIEKLYREQQESLKKLDQSIAFLYMKSKVAKLDKQKQSMLEKMNQSRLPLVQELEATKIEYKKLSSILQDVKDGIIKVLDTVYPGVRLTIGNTVRYIDDNTPRCLIRKCEGEIKIGE